MLIDVLDLFSLHPAVKAVIKRENGLLKRKSKQDFDRWRNYVTAVNNKKVLDGVKSMELKARLDKVARRTLRDDTEKILADGSKVKGVIRKIYSTVLRMPRTAI